MPSHLWHTFAANFVPKKLFGTILDDFGRILGPQNHEKTLKSVELSAKNKVFKIFAWSLQKERQKLTKPSPERPQGPQKRPRRRQERSRRAPRAPREKPRSRQERRRAPRAPGRGPGATSERSWKRFWSLPGLIWELFGSPRDFIFKLFRSCPRTLRLQPLCPTNAGSAGPALAFTIYLPKSIPRRPNLRAQK